VFKMLERQYLTRKGGVRVVYPECQFIEYIVPCVVATFIDIYKDPSVSQDKKKEFLQFVHDLIESYETQEFFQEIPSSSTSKKTESSIYILCSRFGVSLQQID